MKTLAGILVLFFFFSCVEEPVDCFSHEDFLSTSSELLQNKIPEKTNEVIPTFWEMSLIDSSQLLPKGKRMLKLHLTDSAYHESITLQLFEKQTNWQLRQTFYFDNISLDRIGSDFKFEDANGDGKPDVFFRSSIPARGANEVFTLLLYDKMGDSLRWIRNSAEFPNLAYDVEHKYYTAWSVYGGSTSHFLRLQGDSLFEFHSIECFDGERHFFARTNRGKRIGYYSDSCSSVYNQYITYDPVPACPN